MFGVKDSRVKSRLNSLISKKLSFAKYNKYIYLFEFCGVFVESFMVSCFCRSLCGRISSNVVVFALH